MRRWGIEWSRYVPTTDDHAVTGWHDPRDGYTALHRDGAWVVWHPSRKTLEGRGATMEEALQDLFGPPTQVLGMTYYPSGVHQHYYLPEDGRFPELELMDGQWHCCSISSEGQCTSAEEAVRLYLRYQAARSRQKFLRNLALYGEERDRLRAIQKVAEAAGD